MPLFASCPQRGPEGPSALGVRGAPGCSSGFLLGRAAVRCPPAPGARWAHKPVVKRMNRHSGVGSLRFCLRSPDELAQENPVLRLGVLWLASRPTLRSLKGGVDPPPRLVSASPAEWGWLVTPPSSIRCEQQGGRRQAAEAEPEPRPGVPASAPRQHRRHPPEHAGQERGRRPHPRSGCRRPSGTGSGLGPK